jgi:hypothetical protein
MLRASLVKVHAQFLITPTICTGHTIGLFSALFYPLPASGESQFQDGGRRIQYLPEISMPEYNRNLIAQGPMQTVQSASQAGYEFPAGILKPNPDQ